MNKNDERYIKSEKRIQEALLRLIMKKEFALINVKEICEEAGINRNTFYLHHKSKEDLVGSMIDDVNLFFSASTDNRGRGYYELNEKNLQMLYYAMFKYLDNYKNELKAFFNDPNLSGYMTKFENTIKKTMMDYIDFRVLKNEITVDYCISGFLGVLRNWILNTSYTPMDVSEKCTKISMAIINNT